jgi:hypothetical protein
MGLSDTVFDSFTLLLRQYKETYINNGYTFTHQEVFEEMLFNMLKTLYILDLPCGDSNKVVKIPTDEWIRNHIQELIEE